MNCNKCPFIKECGRYDEECFTRQCKIPHDCLSCKHMVNAIDGPFMCEVTGKAVL